jgi:hypothetical protein
MADILSLSKARKARDRAAKDAQANANRVRFGRTKAERLADEAAAKAAARHVDGHRLGTEPPDQI